MMSMNHLSYWFLKCTCYIHKFSILQIIVMLFIWWLSGTVFVTFFLYIEIIPTPTPFLIPSTPEWNFRLFSCLIAIDWGISCIKNNRNTMFEILHSVHKAWWSYLSDQENFQPCRLVRLSWWFFFGCPPLWNCPSFPMIAIVL